jgi:hypothetical protein
MDSRRRFPRSRALLALLVVAALALPASASAFQFEVVNQSGVPDNEVWITVATPEAGYKGDLTNNEAVQLSKITNGTFSLEDIVSGRVLVAYGKQGVEEKTPFINSPTRFDWIELTTGKEGVANLTAVDKFSIGMKLQTVVNGEVKETLGEANADTIFNALQQIPGGPGATERGPNGEIIRVLSPMHSTAYPSLEGYVRSMAGQTIELHTNSNGASSRYFGTFAPDGTATLTGESNPPKQADPVITIPAAELLQDINTGENTPNTLQGAIRRDLYVGFVTGLWGGVYGNDAANFCTNPGEELPFGKFCGKFDKPAFGDARAALSPFATCNQYAAVINQYSDSYGYAYSDASKNTVVQISGLGAPDTLRLTILPDQGSAMPVTSGNPNCGAAPSSGGGSSGGSGGSGAKSGPPAPAAGVAVTPRLLAKTKLKGDKLRLGRVTCSSACGRVRAVVKKGKKKVLARALVKRGGKAVALVAKPTRQGRTLLADGQKNLRLELWVAPAGQKPTHVVRKLTVEK